MIQNLQYDQTIKSSVDRTCMVVIVRPGPIDGGASSSFLAAVSQRMSMPAAVAAAAAHGVLKLDSAQRDYLSALLGGPLPEAEVSLLSQGVTSGNFESISQEELQSAAHALPLVKDVLPDFGDGFLTAALLVSSAASPFPPQCTKLEQLTRICIACLSTPVACCSKRNISPNKSSTLKISD